MTPLETTFSIPPALLEAVFVFGVGYLSGIVTRWFAEFAAIAALALAFLGLAVPASLFEYAAPVLDIYTDNELLFLSGFLFAIGTRRRTRRRVRRRWRGGGSGNSQ